eukprot:s163_g26.t1
MSTVTLQLGQCGNQLGAEVFARLYQEAEAAPVSLSESIHKVFFRQARGRGSDATKALPLARAVLVDTEPRVVQRCLQGNEVGEPRLWRYAAQQAVHHAGGAANNWACGYNVHGPALQEKVLERVQGEVESCDHLGGFLAVDSEERLPADGVQRTRQRSYTCRLVSLLAVVALVIFLIRGSPSFHRSQLLRGGGLQTKVATLFAKLDEGEGELPYDNPDPWWMPAIFMNDVSQ